MLPPMDANHIRDGLVFYLGLVALLTFPLRLASRPRHASALPPAPQEPHEIEPTVGPRGELRDWEEEFVRVWKEKSQTWKRR